MTGSGPSVLAARAAPSSGATAGAAAGAPTPLIGDRTAGTSTTGRSARARSARSRRHPTAATSGSSPGHRPSALATGAVALNVVDVVAGDRVGRWRHVGDHLDRLPGRDGDGRGVELRPSSPSAPWRDMAAPSTSAVPVFVSDQRQVAHRAGRGAQVEALVRGRERELVGAGDLDREVGVGRSAAARRVDRDRVVAGGGPLRCLGRDRDRSRCCRP